MILPEVAWVDWSATAEGIHGISRELLRREGRPAVEVARHAARTLCRPNVTVLVSSEGHDGRWLRLLFHVADLSPPRVHSFLEAVHSMEPLRALLPSPGATDFEERRAYVRSLGWRLVSEAREAEERRGAKTYRALPDAQAMCRVWRSVRTGAVPLAGTGQAR